MSLWEILQPDFVLHSALLASVLLGIAVPPFGVLLFLGRRAILGLALPQISKLGVALALCGMALSGADFSHDLSERALFIYVLIGSAIVMAVALAMLWILEWRGWGTFESNSAALFAVSSAATLSLSAGHWIPELGLLNALKGEIVTVNHSTLRFTACGFAALASILIVCRRHLHAVLFDAWLALACGLRSKALTAIMLVLVCGAVAFGSLCSDPLAIFALLILPPLTVRPFVRRLPMLYAGSSILGLVGAFAGFYLSCAMENWNLPVSAAQILVLGLIWIMSFSVSLKWREAR